MKKNYRSINPNCFYIFLIIAQFLVIVWFAIRFRNCIKENQTLIRYDQPKINLIAERGTK